MTTGVLSLGIAMLRTHASGSPQYPEAFRKLRKASDSDNLLPQRQHVHGSGIVPRAQINDLGNRYRLIQRVGR